MGSMKRIKNKGKELSHYYVFFIYLDGPLLTMGCSFNLKPVASAGENIQRNRGNYLLVHIKGPNHHQHHHRSGVVLLRGCVRDSASAQ